MCWLKICTIIISGTNMCLLLANGHIMNANYTDLKNRMEALRYRQKGSQVEIEQNGKKILGVLDQLKKKDSFFGN
jgi:hypothetical protein